mmetsp:Transcript_30708/g.99313  ORF Transcript_30708/g.99313 Transcript_30708/m.99313 type:complete len:204 (+) Transcript_30708:153-764(+)
MAPPASASLCRPSSTTTRAFSASYRPLWFSLALAAHQRRTPSGAPRRSRTTPSRSLTSRGTSPSPRRARPTRAQHSSSSTTWTTRDSMAWASRPSERWKATACPSCAKSSTAARGLIRPPFRRRATPTWMRISRSSPRLSVPPSCRLARMSHESAVNDPVSHAQAVRARVCVWASWVEPRLVCDRPKKMASAHRTTGSHPAPD